MYISIETYRGFVYPSVIDHVGHMNVQSYTARFDEATWQFLAHLGLTPSFLKRNARGAVAVDQHTQYKREVLAGSLGLAPSRGSCCASRAYARQPPIRPTTALASRQSPTLTSSNVLYPAKGER